MDFPAGIGYQRTMIDLTTARTNMIVSQVRPNGITDARLIDAMAQVPREDFVPEGQRALAYMDEDVPLKPGRFLMEPMALAKLIQLAAVKPEDTVLHVGCASGYGSAILARLAAKVTAIDEDPDLIAQASIALSPLGVTVAAAPHAQGISTGGPYDVILVDGRVPQVPQDLLAQLRDGGRLVAVVGETSMAPAKLYLKHGGNISARTGFEASVSPLPGFAVERPAFVF